MKMWYNKTARRAFINEIKMFAEKCEELGYGDGKKIDFFSCLSFFTIYRIVTQIVFIAKKNKKKNFDLFKQTFCSSSYCLLI